MRKLLPWISLILVVQLAACSLLPTQPPPGPGPAQTPTLSAEQMQTQISQMLTQMPTNANQAQSPATPTVTLPVITIDTATPEQAGGQGGFVVTATTGPQASTNTPPPQPQAQATATTAPQATNTPAPSATATRPSGPTATISPDDPASFQNSGPVTDTMESARAWNWPTGFDEFTSADFRNHAQYITSLTHTDGWRLANPKGSEFGDLLLRAKFTVSECRASDHYGVIVRVPVLHEPTRGYLFGVNCAGEYSLRRWIWNEVEPPKKEMASLIYWTNKTWDGKKANINTLNSQSRTNTLEILINGTEMRLYANGQYLNRKSDNGIATDTYFNGVDGYFGAFVGSPDRADGGFTIKLDEMSYWENPLMQR